MPEQSIDVTIRARQLTEQAFKAVSAAMKGLEDQAVRTGQKSKSALETFEAKAASLAPALQRAGAMATAGLTAPIVAGLGAAVKASIDFETAFAGVRKTVTGTPAELGAIAEGFRAMAKVVPISVTELARVGEMAGQLGVKKENIVAFSRTVADIATATHLTTESAGASFARLANIMRMPQAEFDRLGSAVVALGNYGASTEEEMLSLGLRLAGTGATIGMTAPQVLGLANALSSVGLEAEAGGTALSRVMVKMAAAVDKGGADLQKFASISGMSAKSFAEAFRTDAGNAIVTFIEGLGRIHRSGGNLLQTISSLGVEEVRLRDALLRSANASELVRESMSLGTKAFRENTELSRAAGERYNTTANQLKLLWNQIKDVGIELGDRLTPLMRSQLIPALKDAIGVVGKIVDGFTKLPDGVQSGIVKFGILVAALGPVTSILGRVSGGLGDIAGWLVKIRGLGAAGAAGSALAGGGAGAALGLAGIAVGGAAAYAATKVGEYPAWLTAQTSPTRGPLAGTTDASGKPFISLADAQALAAGSGAGLGGVITIGGLAGGASKPGGGGTGGGLSEPSEAVKNLTKQLAELNTVLLLAEQHGVDMKAVYKEYGTAIEDSTLKARIFGLEVPLAVREAGAAIREARFVEGMRDLAAATAKTMGEWHKDLSEQAKAGAEAVIATAVATADRQRQLAAMAGDYQDQLTAQTQTAADARIAQIDREHRAAIDKLGVRTETTAAEYDRAKAAIDAYYQHERDVASATADTIVERMRAAGIATQADLRATATAAVRDFEHMRASGAFTAEALAEAFKAANEKTAAAFGHSATALQDLAGWFQQLGQIAQGSLGQVIASVGQVVTALAAAKQANIQWGHAITDAAGNVTGFREAAGGIAAPLFSSTATSSQRWAAGLQSAAAVGQGAMNVWSATGSHRTTAGNALGGALAGAQAGAAFGPWGMAVGAAAGLVVGLVRGKPEWAKAADEVGRDFGVKISDGLGKEIAKSAKELFKGDRGAASIFNLDKIIAEAGGLTSKNYTTFMGKLHDVFSMVDVGHFNKDQARQVLDANFGAFAQAAREAAKKTGGVLGKEIREIMGLDKTFGTGSTAVAELVATEVATGLSGLGAFFAQASAIRTSVTDLKQQLADVDKERTALLARQDIGLDDQRRLDELTQAREALLEQLTPQQGLLAGFSMTSQGAASGFAAALSGGISAAVAGGASMVDILTQYGPAIEEFQAQLTTTGFTGGAAFESLQARLAVVRDEIAGPMLQGITNVTTGLTGFYNAGILDADMLGGMTAQIGTMYQSMVDGGHGGEETLQLLQPQLQAIWQIWKDTGWAIDETTQSLLLDAEAAGIVGEKHKTWQERFVDGIGTVVDRLDLLLEGLGVTLPKTMRDAADVVVDDAGRMASGIADAVRAIPSRISIGVDATMEEPEPGTVQGSASGGLYSAPTFRVIAENKPEIVGTPNVIVDALAQALARVGGSFGGGSTTIRIPVILDGRVINELVYTGVLGELQANGVLA